MSDLPKQPTEEELAQFPEAPEAPVVAEDNLEGVDSSEHATLSGAEVDPDGDGEVSVK